jgi:F-type H+-transporting ATPase subunit delta
MKVKIQEYAQLLYNLLINTEDKKIGQLFYGFLCLVESNGDLPKIEKIIMAFEEYYQKKEGLVVAEVTTARKIDEEMEKMIKDYIKKIKPATKKIELKERVDSTELGGVRFMIDDRLVDATIKKQLINLKNSLIQ